jgi:hypothetical protein
MPATEWPASSRNGGRHQIGTLAGFASEWVAGFRRNPQSPPSISRTPMKLATERTTGRLLSGIIFFLHVGYRKSFRPLPCTRA